MLVLQGNVATKLSYGGKFFIRVMSHFFLIPTVKEFQKLTYICQSYSKNESGTVFSDSQCSSGQCGTMSQGWTMREWTMQEWTNQHDVARVDIVHCESEKTVPLLFLL